MAHQKRIFISCSIGTLLGLLGIAAIISIPRLISLLVNEKMPLIPPNPSYPMWRDLDLPIHQSFYLFNVTNAYEVEHSNAKPNLHEVGPFVYRLNLSRSELHFMNNQTLLTFRETRTYYFDRKLSVGDLNTKITTLNVPLVVAWETIDFKSMNKFLAYLVRKLLNSQSYFIDATVDELLFKGKKNMMSCLAHLIDPKKQADCYFAYFRGQNATNDGLYKIHTGLDDLSKVNSIVSINGSKKLDFWDGDKCNRVDGANNGELFPPIDLVKGTNKTIQFFRSDFCRVFNLTLHTTNIESDVTSSLMVDRFYPASDVFANATLNPQNSCYKPNTNKTVSIDSNNNYDGWTMQSLIKFLKDEGFELENEGLKFVSKVPILNNFIENITESILSETSQTNTAVSAFKERPSGVFDMSACQKGVPVFISYPHFMDADPYYLTQLSGLSPNHSRHQTYIDIEPITGTPVDFLARIQINIDVNTTNSGIKMRSLIFPTLWQEFSIHITGKMASTIMFQTRAPKIAAFSIATLILVTGVSLFLYGLFLIWINIHRKRMQKLSTTPLLSDQDDDDANHQTHDAHVSFDQEDNTNNNNNNANNSTSSTITG